MQTKWLHARFGLLAGVAVIFTPAPARAARENPYAVIAVKNCFHLRPAMTGATPPEEPEPPPPTIDVAVAGVTDVCGRPQVLLEITGTGKQTTRPILGEGEALDGIDIVQINVREDHIAARLQGRAVVLTLRPNAGLTKMRGADGPPGIMTKTR